MKMLVNRAQGAGIKTCFGAAARNMVSTKARVWMLVHAIMRTYRRVQSANVTTTQV